MSDRLDPGVFVIADLRAVSELGDTMQGVLAIIAGSVTAPGLAIAGDLDTGVWSSGANILDLTTAGVERLRVDSAQLGLDVAMVARVLSQNRFRHLNSMARVKKTANQSLTSGVSTVITWDNEDYDTDTLHDNATNNNRLTAQIAGKYRIISCLKFASHATGERLVLIRDQSTNTVGSVRVGTNPIFDTVLTVVADWSMAATNWLEVVGYQDSGGALNVLAADSHFSMSYIGE